MACYVALGAAHYIFSQKVVRAEVGSAALNGAAVWGLAFIFTAISLVLPLLYPHPIVRYVVFGIAVVAAVVFRKKIVTKVKEFKG